MNDAVEMTINRFQQNISIKLANDYLSTLLTGIVMKFPVDLTQIFNSVRSVLAYELASTVAPLLRSTLICTIASVLTYA